MSEAKAARYTEGAAIVAGGSGGIGRAICRTLAAGGADVVLTYNRNREAGEAAADEVRALGRRALALQLDLRDGAAVAAAIAAGVAAMGGIHTAVYAAGPYIDMRHVSRLEPALFERTVATDVFGAYNFIHAALGELRRHKGTAIALGTPAIRRYAVKDVLSAAPKAAIEAVIRAVAAEEGRFGVRANFVGVGVITDGMYHQLVATGDFDEAFFEATRKAVALRRLGAAQDIANAVDFLASDAAGYITGQSLMVDGGYAL
ncbi:SDR family NAD(P)-dependent oxidoreductase [Chelatococcus reniformis]|uniref:2-hydroxycyclohexanecarboxyl-CoA dehydrogenase n=1 Tax=Chelatococcus reniformis TaxID=1494448 RepID=A0A916TYI5_9HYPH|nr:SDR family oxidoreductase [Chelatococcus reniformis]GGC49305.1 2-hydroxycyclohexanecarboxyl-CoA dehydrogenase [Chelatococcus reniformis]